MVRIPKTELNFNENNSNKTNIQLIDQKGGTLGKNVTL